LTALGPVRGGPCSPTEPLSSKDTPNAVAVEVRQEMSNHESEVIEGEIGAPAQSADYRALFFGGLPR
jgi:hypothetical protein